LGGCGWKWKGGQHSKRQDWIARTVKKRDGRGKGGGDNMTMDNNDDNNDNNNNDNNNTNNNNTTIKQCTGVRGRRKTVAVMDDGQ
jgi:hypothetical protein